MGNLYRMVDLSLKAAKLLPALRAHDPVNGHWAKLSYRTDGASISELTKAIPGKLQSCTGPCRVRRIRRLTYNTRLRSARAAFHLNTVL